MAPLGVMGVAPVSGREHSLATAALEAVRRHGARVPGIWALEIANVLALAERRQGITTAAANEFLGALLRLRLQVDHDSPTEAFSRVLDLARAQGLTSYDAAYLDLARRHHLPLATLDHDLQKAAKRAGVKLFAG